MYLTGYTAQRKKGLQPYRIGVRGGLPTPESSPEMDYAALSPPMSLPGRTRTPDTLSSGEIPIGMAIGSPSHPPEALPWESPLPATREPLTPPDLYRNATAPVQRQKPQRRRLFGALFGRKKEDQPRESLEGPADLGNKSSMTTTTSVASQPFGESAPARSSTLTHRKAPRYKPIVIRSHTLPVANGPTYEPGSREQRVQPEYQRMDYLSPNSKPPAPPSSTLGSGPLLNVEIPSIQMERYSVMFSNVLNTQATSSALLARRQATLEKLSTINERILHAEEEKDRLLRQPRRATSPQPTKASSGLTLFPPTPNRHAAGPSPLTPRRLARSNTSPALLPSPSRPTFDRHGGADHPRKERRTATVISPGSVPGQQQRNPAAAPPPSHLGGGSRQPEHTIPPAEAEGFQFGPDVSALVLDSPRSTDADDDEPPFGSDPRFASSPVVDAQPLRPAIPEPEWTMIAPAPAPSSYPAAFNGAVASSSTGRSSASSTTTRRSPSSSAASSVHTHVTRPSIDGVAVADRGDPLKAAVEISIARQISLSRQQRTLLLPPLKTDVVGGGGGGGQSPAGRARAATATVAVAREEGRVVETKTGTPTEVNVVDAHPAAQRRSEWVILDGM